MFRYRCLDSADSARAEIVEPLLPSMLKPLHIRAVGPRAPVSLEEPGGLIVVLPTPVLTVADVSVVQEIDDEGVELAGVVLT